MKFHRRHFLKPRRPCRGTGFPQAALRWIIRPGRCALGGEPLSGSPADFGKLIAEETDKWPR
jgi:hypothetical protein